MMKSLMIGVQKFMLPECFDECSDAQKKVLVVCGIVGEERRNRAFWELVIRTGLGCDDGVWRKLVLSLEQWDLLKRLMAWVFVDRVRRRPFGYIDWKGVRYWAMKEGFDDSDAIEVSVGAMYFLALTNESNPDYGMIELLMAVFIRPERKDLKRFRASEEWDGDVREPYNEQRVIERAEVFRDLDFGVKVLFLQWFEAEFMAFTEVYRDVFGKGRDEEQRYDDGRGWVMLLKHVATKGYFGNLAGVHRTNVHDVWSYLLDDVLDSKIKN